MDNIEDISDISDIESTNNSDNSDDILDTSSTEDENNTEDIMDIEDADNIENSENIEVANTINTITKMQSSYDPITVSNKKNKTSPIWNYIEEQKIENQVVARICKVEGCETIYSATTSTGILNKHLKNKHNIILNLKTNRLYLSQEPYGKKDIKRKQECFNATVDLIIGAQLPFSFINNYWFCKAVNVYDPRYKLPSIKFLKNTIMNRFKTHRIYVAKELEKLTTKVALTADIWTSSSNQAYLGITIHYIDNEWKMKRFLLDIIHFKYNHNALRIKEKLNKICEEMNIIGKVISLTTDNASAMVLCGEFIENEWNTFGFHHHRCAAHVLNIAIKNGIESQDSVIVKVRKFINRIQKSTILCDRLRDFCSITKKNYNTLIIDVVTRWNSTYYMLNRFKNLHNELNLLKTAYPELDNNYPDEEEWKNINNIIFLLEPMLHATEILSTSSYPTIADVRLTFLGIIRHLELFINNNLYSENEQTMAYFIKNKLNDYWSIINHDESTRIASVLDPTSKLTTFPVPTEKDTVLISLRNIMNQYKPLALTSTSVFDDKRKWFVSLISQQTIVPPLAEELELYLSTPPISSSIQNGCLQWWAANKYNYPVLAKIAQDFLTIQATSVPCEEAFSIASKTLSKFRNRLKPKTARASLCLKNWMENNIGINTL